ncbi:MAG TPA: glutathione S-transferase family protein [Pseudomonadales bacterium]
MKIYGASLSPFVRKTLLALETKGIAYEQVPVVPFTPPPDYERISPLKKIPAMEHDGFTVSDSSVICEYLEEVFPDVPLRPADPRQRATARFLEEFGDTRLVENVAAFFLERIVKPVLLKQETDEARLKDVAANQLPPVLGYLEAVVPEAGFLFGAQQPGLADFSLASPLVNAQYAGYEVDGRNYPKLAAFFGRVCAAPVVAKRLEIERRELAALQGGRG